MFADGPNGSFFDFPMAGDTGYLSALRVEPNSVRAALTVQNTRMLAQVALQVGELHPLSQLKGFADGPGRKTFLRKLPLAVQY